MINLTDIKFSYKSSQRLFEGLNLKLEKGKIVGLLGRNGEGKSTLMKLIIGQLIAKQGQVQTLGHLANKREAEFLQKVYILPEELELPNMKVGKYLNVFGSFYPTYDEALSHELVEIFGIKLDMNLKAMSLGQKKKAAIVLALALRTPLLLMDEPTNGLDIPSKSVFRRQLARLSNEEQTVIISTHQVRDLEQLIDHILLLDQNKIICNASLLDLSEKLDFLAIDQYSDRSKLIYAEQAIGAEYGVFASEDGMSESEFSMELFFNAMVSNAPMLLEQIKDINNI